MLNIIRLNLKNKYKNISVNTKSLCIKPKEYMPAVRHWKNSIYVYNKNTLSLIPEASNLTIKLIKGYLNLYKFKLEKKIRLRLKLFLGENKWEQPKKYKKKNKVDRRLLNNSVNKVYVSQGEFKHTNDKINIILYFYDKQISNIYNIRKKVEKLALKSKKKYKREFYLKKMEIKLEKKRFVKKLNSIKWKIFSKLKKNKDILKLKDIKMLNIYKEKYKKLCDLKYFEIILLHKSLFKWNICYILKGNKYDELINLIRKIYKKKIVLKLINIKHFYLNSNIFTQILVLKLKKNRRKLRRYLKTIILKTKVKTLKQIKGIVKNSHVSFISNQVSLLDKTNKRVSYSPKYKILKKIKYKRLSGVKLQAKGRLGRRYTASRSLKRVKHKGSIMNIYSSLFGLRSCLLKGKFKSNFELTKLKSKTRIGSFGIKGWISGV